MRLFVAIDLNEDVRRAMADEQTRLRTIIGHDARTALKWVAPAHMHLTLAFLGEVDPLQAERVLDAMRPPFDVPRFSMAFGGVGVFPPRGAPRVVWVGLRRGVNEVVEVQQRVTTRIARAGVTLEERGFHPHLTLARWRTSRPADRDRALGADRGRDAARLDVEAVTVIHSRLSPDGPRHTPLLETPLGKSVDPPLQSS